MPKVAFLFPGQGAQTVGMARTLCDTVGAVARQLFADASTILGYDLLDICLNGPVDKLNSTVVSQPAIFVASLAALESLRQTDVAGLDTCSATAGLSLGEYTALVFAGAMNFADGLRLVQQRGQAMQAAADATPSAMVSVLGLERPQVEELCAKARSEGLIQLANLLCPGNLVVSGTAAAIAAVEKHAETAGVRTIKLAVAGAFHTPLMKPADDVLAAALAKVAMQTPRVPVWCNVDATAHTDPRALRELLVRQVVEPVLWEQTMRGLLAEGFDRFYEIGPGRVLAGLLKRVNRKTEIVNVTA